MSSENRFIDSVKLSMICEICSQTEGKLMCVCAIKIIFSWHLIAIKKDERSFAAAAAGADN